MTSIITFGDIVKMLAIAYGLGVGTPIILVLIVANWPGRKK